MTELEAARFVRAALDMIVKNVPPGSMAHAATMDYRDAIGAEIKGMEQTAPPWEDHAARPERAATWGTVVPGDYVLAPNGEWYMVDSWSRIGDRVGVLIKVGTETAPDTFGAGTPVTIRRGPEGQAVDVLAAAGITGEVV